MTELFWRWVFHIPKADKAPYAGRAAWHFWKRRRCFLFLRAIWVILLRKTHLHIEEQENRNKYWQTIRVWKASLEEFYYEGPEIVCFTLRIGSKTVLRADDL